jgi:hypothetical protein
MKSMPTLLVAAIGFAVLTAPAVLAQGKVKSQVIWSAKVIPPNAPLNVDKDKMQCLGKGPILKDELIIDAKTKGVKNVVFWLVDAKEPMKPIPTPKALQGKVIDIDQPCCKFISRHTVILDGQKLVVKNSSPIAHNVSFTGGEDGPNLNVLTPAKGQLNVGAVKPRPFPIVPYSCSIHPWMRGFVLPLPSPYYAITDAEGKFEIKDVPAGEYRLVGWHEQIGWIFPGPKDNTDMAKRNVPVTVKNKETTELKPLPRKVVEDE